MGKRRGRTIAIAGLLLAALVGFLEGDANRIAQWAASHLTAGQQLAIFAVTVAAFVAVTVINGARFAQLEDRMWNATTKLAADNSAQQSDEEIDSERTVGGAGQQVGGLDVRENDDRGLHYLLIDAILGIVTGIAVTLLSQNLKIGVAVGLALGVLGIVDLWDLAREYRASVGSATVRSRSGTRSGL